MESTKNKEKTKKKTIAESLADLKDLKKLWEEERTPILALGGVALILIGLIALLYFPLSFYAHIFPMGAEAARLDFAVLAIASVLTGVQCAFASLALGLFYLRVK